jgi:signal transduction histidine kinase
MIISGLFTLAIYSNINQELIKLERTFVVRVEKDRFGLEPSCDQIRQERMIQGLPVPKRLPLIDPQEIEQARWRIKAALLFLNIGILGISGVAGYFLAGRTLKPIKEMVDEQNRFITDSSHELRTPLTSLKTELEVTLRDPNLNLSDATKTLQSNLEEVNKLQYLSDNLIKLTQHRLEETSHAFTEVTLEEILEEAIKKTSKFASTKNIHIDNRSADYTLTGDKISLTELFVTLFDNAIKYSPADTTVSVVSEKTDGNIFVKVIDQGIGIDQKDISHIFNRFYRADKSRTKSESNGYGLGLAIAKQIVEKHKGTIKVESKIGKGSTFIVRLPAF